MLTIGQSARNRRRAPASSSRHCSFCAWSSSSMAGSSTCSNSSGRCAGLRTTDPLTGPCQPPRIQLRLDEEVAAARMVAGLSRSALLDLDGFKGGQRPARPFSPSRGLLLYGVAERLRGACGAHAVRRAAGRRRIRDPRSMPDRHCSIRRSPTTILAALAAPVPISAAGRSASVPASAPANCARTWRPRSQAVRSPAAPALYAAKAVDRGPPSSVESISRIP